ncbi:ABC transporter permease [Suttonella ornithocola]|uniref:Inner membrane transport permease yhhJ n=1 Tax=Suttonella ornithocola TaxID=279832 RepID=A0A380MRK6_9GAMM|nr:ABC transporter permease [Suttonella ornithocola]SUO93957.1 Inner membrane transport permease yhhJ [Suttonella ornithocola]
MLQSLKNIWTLTLKEFQSLLSDRAMLGIITIIFTVAVIAITNGVSIDVKNATVAVVDHDRSPLSQRITSALLSPYFQPPVLFEDMAEAHAAMDKAEYIFIMDIPPHFEEDVLKARHPAIQITADATALSQAGVGFVYLQQIISEETLRYFQLANPAQFLPMKPVINVSFNPNTDSRWYLAVMNVATFTFMLAMLLVGAAVIRERERGTMEHLLVMPITANEIAAAKIIANSTVIALAALASMQFVVKGILAIPISGSLALFALGIIVFLFSATALGVLLATTAPTMPQFILLMLPMYIVLRLISGGETPLASMPNWLQTVSQASPMTQFVEYSSAVLFRNADITLVQKPLFIMAMMGVLFLVLALSHFRSMLDKQG